MYEYGLMPSKNSDIRNVEVVTFEISPFNVGFDNLQDARHAALIATEYGDIIENFYRDFVNDILENLLGEIDSIVARHNKDVGKFKKNSAISQRLSDDDKAAINQLYSAKINGIIGDIRNAIIDEINGFNGDDDDEEVKEDFATYLRRFEENGGEDNAV